MRGYRFCFHRTVLVFLLATSWTPAWAEPMKEVAFVTAMEGETKVWTPATLAVQKGEKVKLTLHNALKAEHGFAIDALDIHEIIASNETKEVIIEPAETGEFRFYCPLHKAHVGGQLRVEE